MVKEYNGFKVGDLIQIKCYEECALWWYTDLYRFFGKKLPETEWGERNKIWKVESITEPREILNSEGRYLLFLTCGEQYLGIDITYRPDSFSKINSYTLRYEKKK